MGLWDPLLIPERAMRPLQQEDTGPEGGAGGVALFLGLRKTSGVEDWITLGLHGLLLWFEDLVSSFAK